MKKLFLSLVVLLTATHATKAEDGFSVNALTIPQGRTAELEIVFESAAAMYNRFQLEVQMPEGITYVQDEEGDVTCAKGALIASTDHSISASHIASKGMERFICVSMNNHAIPAGKGVVLTVTYQADASLAVGATMTGHIKNALWNDAESNAYKTEDIPFTVTIGEPRVLLSETSLTAPEAEANVDVRVARTIKANEWSTIVLPFAMNETQLEDAFGDDVQLADFTGVTTEQDADDNTVGLSMNFVAASAIEANHPYLIKVSSLINEFTVDGVTIDPDEVVSLDRDELRLGSGKQKAPYRYLYNSFVGTYVANTEVPNMGLFLNGNKFWYSAGKTKMKAFRAYFDFYDILTEVEDALAEAKIRFTVDEKPTRIEGVGEPNVVQGAVYNVNGQLVGHDIDLNSQPKGIYFVDGKKVVNY